MKNYVIGTLAVIILILVSIMYKNNRTIGTYFPIQKEEMIRANDADVPMFVYIFFSKLNCRDCLEVIKVLNDLPFQFVVTGVVPQDELKDENELRGITGAEFPLKSLVKYKAFTPWYAPTIIGVASNGKIAFTLPGAPGEAVYLKNFLESFYGKTYPHFLE
jgi:hypothetical protein